MTHQFDRVQDSGAREEFATGAVRDLQQVKGSNDLGVLLFQTTKSKSNLLQNNHLLIQTTSGVITPKGPTMSQSQSNLYQPTPENLRPLEDITTRSLLECSEEERQNVISQAITDSPPDIPILFEPWPCEAVMVIAEKPMLLPYRANPTDAGADLKANHNFVLAPGERRTVHTGVRVNIPPGYAGLICGRSGLASNQGIDVLGGVIDAGFQGELCAVLVNTSRHSRTFCQFDRIAQLLIIPVATPTFEPIGSFNTETARGTDGWGSTGV